MPTRTQIYVRRGDKWLVAANFVQRVRYGLAPVMSQAGR